ncbi:MAG: ribonuclease E activity regulator RraA [Candidatus Rariloculaceae bacterium]
MSGEDFTSTCDLYDEYLTDARVPSTVLKHFGGRIKFSGIAVTVQCFEDNSRVKELAQTPGEGKVMVVDGGGSYQCALVGDVIAGMARDNGWEGIVIFGCVRDSAELANLDLGLMALATTPRKSVRKDVGETDLTISFGDTTCHAGDRVFVDEDGVLLLDSDR